MRVLLALCLAGGLAFAGETPRLVVLISVDQMRADTFAVHGRDLKGGLHRLYTRGLRFDGMIGYAGTETGPGHASMATGCWPSVHGIIANRWFDPKSGEVVYCVGGGKGAPNPKLCLRPALGDWMKQANPKSRVYSVSGKDRAAVLTGGQHADGAFWLGTRQGGFVTSAHYPPALWLEAFNKDGFIESVPEVWSYHPVEWLRPDDHKGESSDYARTSPHPLRAAQTKMFMDRLFASPYGDAWTLRLAAHIVESADLGEDDAPDLLCVSLSSTDIIGHRYGPFSQEMHANIVMLDRNLGAFLDVLDKRGHPYVVALTSDHGVLPITDARLVPLQNAMQNIMVALQKDLGAGDWLRFTGALAWINPKAVTAAMPRKRIGDALVKALTAQDGVAAVYTRAQITGDSDDPMLRLVRRSHHASRGADLRIVPAKGVLITPYPAGTSHGSPHEYDRRIPVLFYGAGVGNGVRDKRAGLVDVAPTLARHLRIPVPAGVNGAALPLH